MVELLRLVDHNARFTTESTREPKANGQLATGIPELSYGPFRNPTELDFMEWVNGLPSELSEEKAQAFVTTAQADHFNAFDLKKINVSQLNKRLDAYSLEDHLACADWKN